MKLQDWHSDAPEWAADRLTVQVDVYLDWRDRLRLLLSGKMRLTVNTWCEVPPGRAESHTKVRVLKRWPSGPTEGQAEIAPDVAEVDKERLW